MNMDITPFRDRLVSGVRANLYAKREDFTSSITADFELQRELTAHFNEVVEDFCERLECTLSTSYDETTGHKNFVIKVIVRDKPEEEVDESPSV